MLPNINCLYYYPQHPFAFSFYYLNFVSTQGQPKSPCFYRSIFKCTPFVNHCFQKDLPKFDKSNIILIMRKKKFFGLRIVVFALIVAVLGTGFVWSTEIEDGVNGILGNQRSPDIIEFDGGLAINFIDVGQGDAALLQFPGGQRMLVDAGRHNITHNRFREELNNLVPGNGHNRRIDYFIMTHSHADHIGSAPYVIQNYTVRNIIRPKSFTRDEVSAGIPSTRFGLSAPFTVHAPNPQGNCPATFINTVSAMQSSFGNRTQSIAIPSVASTAYTNFVSGRQDLHIRSFTIGQGGSAAVVTFYSPTTHHYTNYGINELSTIFCIYFNGFRILFTGDSYIFNENNVLGTLPQNICVLVVSHHGSNTSTGQAFVDHISPNNQAWHAIIQVGTTSTGKSAAWQHPHPTVVQRIEDAGAYVHMTRDLGDILVRVSACGAYVEVAGFMAPNIWIYYWWIAVGGAVLTLILLFSRDLFGRKNRGNSRNNNNRNANRNNNNRNNRR